MYTEFQRELISKIIEKKIFNLSSFNEEICKNDYYVKEWINPNNNNRLATSIIPSDKEVTKEKFMAFISLIKILQKKKHIELFPDHKIAIFISKEEIVNFTDTFENPPQKKQRIYYPYDREIMDIYKDYIDKRIYVPVPFKF